LVRAALTIRFPSGFPFRSLREALDMDPEDVDFAVRGPLLCLYLDKAMTEDSEQRQLRVGMRNEFQLVKMKETMYWFTYVKLGELLIMNLQLNYN
jgi:hypothetical protein